VRGLGLIRKTSALRSQRGGCWDSALTIPLVEVVIRALLRSAEPSDGSIINCTRETDGEH
jgi:hypothetical protein